VVSITSVRALSLSTEAKIPDRGDATK